MNELILNTSNIPTFQNKELNKAAAKITNISGKIRKNLFEIAKILDTVATSKCYEDDGFKSAAEFAMKTFGFKKTFAYSLIKIGSEYTAPTLESNLPHEEGNDFTVTQVERLLPLNSRETAVKLVESGEIKPDMSCKEIAEVVKSKLPKKDKPAPEPENHEPEPEQENPSEEETEQQKEDRLYYNAYAALLDLAESVKGTEKEAQILELSSRLNEVMSVYVQSDSKK